MAPVNVLLKCTRCHSYGWSTDVQDVLKSCEWVSTTDAECTSGNIRCRTIMSQTTDGGRARVSRLASDLQSCDVSLITDELSIHLTPRVMRSSSSSMVHHSSLSRYMVSLSCTCSSSATCSSLIIVFCIGFKNNSFRFIVRPMWAVMTEYYITEICASVYAFCQSRFHVLRIYRLMLDLWHKTLHADQDVLRDLQHDSGSTIAVSAHLSRVPVSYCFHSGDDDGDAVSGMKIRATSSNTDERH